MNTDEHHEAYKEQHERADDVNDDEYFERDNEAGPLQEIEGYPV
jgi:hypothetical protein